MSTSILRQAIVVARNATRTFTSTAASRKGFVQDLYVKELKAYKAPPTAQDAHVGLVKTYTAPTPPKAPILPQDLASELSAYDASEPGKVQAIKSTASHAEAASGSGAEEFLSFLEADIPKAEEAHH